jgi:hypothetical protein
MVEHSLSSVENKIVQEYSRDGMIETLIAVASLWSGFVFLTKPASPFMVLPILMILGGRAWRRWITYPRLGYTELIATRRVKRKKAVLLILLAALAVGGLIALGLTAGEATFAGSSFFQQSHARIIFGFPIGIIIAGVALVTRTRSLYWAAGILVALFVISDWQGVTAGYAFLVVGTGLLIVGLTRLVLFLRANPKLEGADLHEPRP